MSLPVASLDALGKPSHAISSYPLGQKVTRSNDPDDDHDHQKKSNMHPCRAKNS